MQNEEDTLIHHNQQENEIEQLSEQREQEHKLDRQLGYQQLSDPNKNMIQPHEQHNYNLEATNLNQRQLNISFNQNTIIPNEIYQSQQKQQFQQHQQQYYSQQPINPQLQTYQNSDGVNQSNPPQSMDQQLPEFHVPQGQPVKQSQIAPLQNQTLTKAQIFLINKCQLKSANGQKYPTQILCPSCNSLVQTTIKKSCSISQHKWALCLCILCPPFCFIPYLADCDNIDHICPSCQAKVGERNYRRRF